MTNFFLRKLNEWRIELAKNIALNNKWLSEEDLNFAVQIIIDRIIFLRFCEDRGIEPFKNLIDVSNKKDTYKNLIEIFDNADKKYKSGLFDFKKDTITPKIKIDDKTLKNIIEELYHPKTENGFKLMTIDMLGNAYEQFLGNVIKITQNDEVIIVEKPEVKKSGGVFYTPQFIVEYIVENTVGKLIHDKTPEQISKIKIIDPACGSGVFLLGAYIYLLKHHNEYYLKEGIYKEKIKNSPITPEGKLTITEKKRILLNNIYGVDIDPNAVEVAKLSLLLKTLEEETKENIHHQLESLNGIILPNLENNIKCGNSLIGLDFFNSFLQIDDIKIKELEKKLKPFDWKSAFPKIFQDGGFDAVIGNPPWVSLSGKFGNDILDKDALKYLINKYNGNSIKFHSIL